MTNFKKKLTVGTMVLGISISSLSVFAATAYKTPADVASGVTGKTIESVISEKRDTGKTYGTIAKEAGKLDEFKAEALEMKKANLEEQVKSGIITQEEADAIIKAIEENIANCDGSGSAKLGQSMGARFGSNGTGLGNGGASRGSGLGRNQGKGRGTGNFRNAGIGGMGLQDGSCYTE